MEHKNIKIIIILAKAASDEHYLNNLHKNPEKVLEEEGIDIASINLDIIRDPNKLKEAIDTFKDLKENIFKIGPFKSH